jgi:hydrogenase maturation protein HypF
MDLIDDVQKGIPLSIISTRFHNTIASMVTMVCNRLRTDYHVTTVVLSGGVWQNMALLHRTHYKLVAENFEVYIHNKVPTNDGGLALGQAVVAIHRMSA